MTKYEELLTKAVSPDEEFRNSLSFCVEEAILTLQNKQLALKRRRNTTEGEIRSLELKIRNYEASEWIDEMLAKKKKLAMIAIEEKLLSEIEVQWFKK